MLRKRNKLKRFASIFLSFLLVISLIPVNAADAKETSNTSSIGKVSGIQKEGSDIYLDFSSGQGIKLSFLKDNVFRLHLDPSSEFPEYPTPNKPDHVTKIVDKDKNDYQKEYGTVNVKVKEDSDFLGYIQRYWN